jgi:hypothetical protein
VVTGLSLVLNKEFNGFEELLRKKQSAPVVEDKKEEQP